MSTSIAATQHKPRALHRYTPATTNYVELLYNGAALPDWITAIRIRSGAPVRVAHWGVADGDAIGTVSEYEDLGAIGGGVILRRGGLRVFVSGITSVPVEFVAAGFGVDLGMAPYVVPRDSFVMMDLADATHRADEDPLLDPNTDLVSVTCVDGLWTVTAKCDSALTLAETGIAFAFPIRDIFGRAFITEDRDLKMWQTVMHITSAPTQGDGLTAMVGICELAAGALTVSGRWSGMEYTDATFPQARVQIGGQLTTGGVGADAGVDRVYGGALFARPKVSSTQIAARMNHGGAASDPRASDLDTDPGLMSIRASNLDTFGKDLFAVISVFPQALAANNSISFYAWYEFLSESRQP